MAASKQEIVDENGKKHVVERVEYLTDNMQHVDTADKADWAKITCTDDTIIWAKVHK